MSNVHSLEEVMRKKQEMEASSLRSSLDQSLQFGGGGGTSGPMETVDAKISASEARTDTKFAELRGDLKDFATKGTVWGAVATAVVAILGVLVGLIAFGGDRFDAGLGMADVRHSQIQRDEKQDQLVAGLNQKLDRIIAAQEQRPNSGN